MAKYKVTEVAAKKMSEHNYADTRLMAIAAHVDHGKTTTADSLIAAAGLLSVARAGEALVLDAWHVEQERQMTVFASAAVLPLTFKDKQVLLEVIDTPGHIDFTGMVTRALRAADGVMIVIDASEGVQTQTETVVRQALSERVKPVLYVNKIDLLISTLRLTPEELQQKLIEIVSDVNKLIDKYAPEEFRKEWRVDVMKGTVTFGSAKFKFGLNIQMIKKKGITFKDIIRYINESKAEELAKLSPLHEALLEMIIPNLPDPISGIKLRLSKMWPGDAASEMGQKILAQDPSGPLIMVVTHVETDPHAGLIGIGRVLSGTAKVGKQVYMLSQKTSGTIGKVYLYLGKDKDLIDEIPAGNIAAISGVPLIVGETLVEQGLDITPFESLRYVSEPVMSASIEPLDVKQLPKLIETLKLISTTDPTIKFRIDEETGANIIETMGSLHIEIVEAQLKDLGLKVKVSPPIVTYREAVKKASPELEVKTQNRLNRFIVAVEPLEPRIYEALRDGEIAQGKVKDRKALARKLREFGMDTEEGKNVTVIFGTNMLVNMVRGRQYVEEVMESIMDAVELAVDEGPLCKERVSGLKVKLLDAVIHVDPSHRSPGQIVPALRNGIYAAILSAVPTLLEPKLRVLIRVPTEMLGIATRELQTRRGQIIDVNTEDEQMVVNAKAPIETMLDFSDAIRSGTQGKALWSVQFESFEELPRELQMQRITEIRGRKGLKVDVVPKAEDFLR